MGRDTAGGARRRITAPGPKARLEPVIAQNPQHILGDAGGGITNKADPAGPQIREAPDRIVERAVGSEKDRVDGEIAPCCIRRPIRVESNASAAAVAPNVCKGLSR